MYNSGFFILIVLLVHFCSSVCLSQASRIEIKKDLGFGDPIGIDVSPDNKYLSLIYHHGTSDSYGFLKIYGIDDGKVEWDVKEESKILDAEFSKSGNHFAYVTKNTLHIWNLVTKKQLIVNVPEVQIKEIDFGSDDNFLAIANHNPKTDKYYLSVYDIGRMKPELDIELSNYTSSLDYLNSPNKIAVSGEQIINIYNSENGTLEKTIDGYNSVIHDILVVKDSIIISGDNQFQKIHFWDMANGQETRSLVTNESGSAVDISPDYRYLSFAGENPKSLNIYDLETERTITFDSPENIRMTRFSPDMKFIYWLSNWNIYKQPLDKDILRAKHYSKIYNDQWKKIYSEYKYFKPRDEFETREIFYGRAQQLVNRINSIKSEYISQIRNQEDKILDERNEQVDEINKQVAGSIRDTTLSITSINDYEVNSQVMTLTIQHNNFKISIAPNEAKELKENYKQAVVRSKCKLNTDLKTLTYFDMIIIHPISNNEYPVK